MTVHFGHNIIANHNSNPSISATEKPAEMRVFLLFMRVSGFLQFAFIALYLQFFFFISHRKYTVNYPLRYRRGVPHRPLPGI